MARSVAPKSSAPASDVTNPASNAASTARPSTLPKSNRSALHSVGIGALLESSESRSRTTKIGRDRIEKNPDKRVQDALQLVFTRFAELRSARQVHIWLRDEGIELPVKSRQGEAHGVEWRLPAYNI